MLFVGVVRGWQMGRGGGARIIVPHQKLFMSVEEQEEQMDLAYQSLKIRSQNTTTYVKQKSPHEHALDLDPLDPADCSFERGIHQENMEVLRAAAAKYLEDTLEAGLDKTEGFRDAGLYENLPFEVGGGHELEELTVHNETLTEREKEELLGMLKREEELVGLLREAVPVFGITVGKEVVFAIYHLLRLKLEPFRTIRDPNPTLIPRFDCFFGFEEEETALTTACPLYEDINLEEVGAFAEKDLQELSSMLYFSCQVKYLNLREAKPDTKCHVLPRFNSLIRQLARTVFFTLAGAIESASLSGCSLALDLSREVSFADFSEANILSMRRSMSRPFVPCEEEQMDFTSKRRKFE